ncbi:MAG: ABC transporter ATP-binding protein, partial [Clostridia bacterium]|nr:ABC transporter ATP-binding protein [Clostridia bacterium]
MLKRLAKCIKEYKKPTIITLAFIILEAIIECLLPFITADLVNKIKAGADMSQVGKTGAILVFMSAFSLLCGAIAGIACAKASTGFAKNLRHDIFYKIQDFTFSNIDKFYSSS